jgi:hypothetical protein
MFNETVVGDPLPFNLSLVPNGFKKLASKRAPYAEIKFPNNFNHLMSKKYNNIDLVLDSMPVVFYREMSCPNLAAVMPGSYEARDERDQRIRDISEWRDYINPEHLELFENTRKINLPVSDFKANDYHVFYKNEFVRALVMLRTVKWKEI